jgi:hypothetical protein
MTVQCWGGPCPVRGVLPFKLPKFLRLGLYKVWGLWCATASCVEKFKARIRALLGMFIMKCYKVSCKKHSIALMCAELQTECMLKSTGVLKHIVKFSELWQLYFGLLYSNYFTFSAVTAQRRNFCLHYWDALWVNNRRSENRFKLINAFMSSEELESMWIRYSATILS